ncbi:hypothetical protein [Salinibacter altiplanensis]|uniref:hypothetical protein n=1 Tax=Salinibacter altiplanensis TaxID=1803181 RepID=UPI001F3FFD8F|nr:hypothetical protein [Salinibacter altiplanensis]
MRVTLMQVEVQVVPFGSGEREDRWDLFSGPDLYYKAYDPEGACLHASAVVDDVEPQDLPVTLDAEFAVEASGWHRLRLLDADLIEDEVVGAVDFAPDRILNGSPASAPARTVRLSDGDVTLQLTLEWTTDSS